jgi:hypothetical protein
MSRLASAIERTRAILAARTEPCGDDCPGWLICNQATHPEIQTCIECFPGKGGPTDTEVARLPEAYIALARALAEPIE